MPMKPAHENNFNAGNPKDGKHYWLSPKWLLNLVRHVIGDFFDPCPFPKPDGFDGLRDEWDGDAVYINPPFGSVIYPGTKKKIGMTAWVRRAIAEKKKGKDVIMVYPQHRWIHMLVEAGAEFISIGDVEWESTEDSEMAKSASSPTMAFVLRGKKKPSVAESIMCRWQLRNERQQIRNYLRAFGPR